MLFYKNEICLQPISDKMHVCQNNLDIFCKNIYTLHSLSQIGKKEGMFSSACQHQQSVGFFLPKKVAKKCVKKIWLTFSNQILYFQCHKNRSESLKESITFKSMNLGTCVNDIFGNQLHLHNPVVTGLGTDYPTCIVQRGSQVQIPEIPYPNHNIWIGNP